jgi:hypothetical protein
MMAFLLIAMLTALRMRTSSKGFFCRVVGEIADVQAGLLEHLTFGSFFGSRRGRPGSGTA